MSKRLARMSAFIFLLSIFSFAIVFGFEYEKPNKVSVFTIPTVTYNSIGGKFLYEYTVLSTNASIQEVWAFSVILNERYSNVVKPAGWEVFKPKNPKLPNMVDWAAVGGNSYIPSHSNVDPSPFQIKPGSSLSGFSFESPSLPGVVNFFAEGFTKLPEFPKGMVEKRPPGYNRLDDVFKSMTIGPVFVGDTSINSLIDRLITLKDSMPSYNWITNQGIINSLNAKLDSAKSSLLRGNFKTAKNQLNAFINELDVQKGKHVNENAWALLKANAEYLLTKIGE